MDWYRNLLQKQLNYQHERVRFRPAKDSDNWSKLPTPLIPKRLLSGKVRFLPCVWRRKGYLAIIKTNDFMDLVGNPKLEAEVGARLEDHLCRGLLWKPLVLPIKASETSVQVKKPEPIELNTAAFMAEKGQKYLQVQAYHADGTLANASCLSLMQEKGLVPLNGGEPLLPVRVHVTL